MTAPAPPKPVIHEHDKTAASAYGLNDMPPVAKAVPLALQHLLAMFVGNATPPLIVATAIGMATDEVTLMVQLAMVVSGVTTLLQTALADADRRGHDPDIRHRAGDARGSHHECVDPAQASAQAGKRQDPRLIDGLHQADHTVSQHAVAICAAC